MPEKIDWGSINKQTLDLENKHAVAVGQALSAWNLCQDTFGALFAEVVITLPDMALAIWYSQESDRSQRKMLLAASKIAHGEKNNLYKEIKWACNRADSLSETRNNVAHVGYSITPDETLSSIGIKPRGVGAYSRADKMSNRDILAELEAFTENCKVLIQFIAGLYPAVSFPEQRPPLPERPSLLKPAALPTPTRINLRLGKK